MENVFYLLVLPLFLSLYFEFLGRWILYKLKIKNFKINFPIGFFVFQALIYPTSLLTNNGISFYILAFIYIAIILVTTFCIFRDINKINLRFDYIAILVLILITIILSYYSFNTSLGNLNGFDTVHYLNMMTQNIGLDSINSKDIYLNGELNFSMTYYSGQVYYYFVSVIIYAFGKIASLLKIRYYYMTAAIWSMQIMFNMTIGAIFVEACYIVKNKLSIAVCSLPVVFVLGKLYYNNVFGFFGNSWFTLLLSYVSILLIYFLNEKEKSYKYLIYMLLLGNCSFTSSGIYTLLFVLFALFFFDEDINLLKEYSLIILLPLYNSLFMERLNNVVVILVPIVIAVVMFAFGKKIIEIINNYNLRKYILIFSIVTMFSLSRIYSTGLFDFSGLLNTLSQNADMTLDYFSFISDSKLIIIYKLFILILLCVSFLLNHRNELIKFYLILIAVFFNPFCCNFLNYYISVYYRSYSIIINFFTIIFLFDLIISKLNKYIGYIIYATVFIIFLFNLDFINPLIYNYEFIQKANYNPIYKMTNSEFEVIEELKSNIDFFEDKNPYIVTGNILTQSMLPKGKYLYGRSYIKSKKWTNAENKLYEIFYTPEYLGDSLSKNPDYENMMKYIEEANIDYIVVDKNVEMFDSSKNDYNYLYYKVNELCNTYPIFENKDYALYRFSD